jgi:hypothetical protein
MTTMTATPALDALSTIARGELAAGGVTADTAAAHEWQQGFMAALDCMFLIPGTLMGLRHAVWREWMQFSPDITEQDIKAEGRRIANVCVEAARRMKGRNA